MIIQYFDTKLTDSLVHGIVKLNCAFQIGSNDVHADRLGSGNLDIENLWFLAWAGWTTSLLVKIDLDSDLGNGGKRPGII